MELPPGHGQLTQGAQHRRGHAGRSAHIDVPVGDVRYEQGQFARGQIVRGGRPGDQVQLGALGVGQFGQLLVQDRVPVGGDAVDEHDVAVEFLKERADGGDADASGDEQGVLPGAVHRGEGAVRALREHPGTDLQLAQRRRAVAGGLDGEPEPVAVGGRREREGVRLPPAVPRQEPPEEELARAGGQPVQVAAGDVDRDDVVGLGDDGRHPQPVAQVSPQGQDEAADEPAERDRHLARLRAEAARMGLLLDDLLLLARLDAADVEAPLRLEETDPAELLNQAADAFRAGRPDHPLSVRVDGGPVRMRLDPLRIRQVLDNLLTNAAVHTPARTPVSLELSVERDAAVVRVGDRGPGIPATDQERVFDRFYRVDKARTRDSGGSGLELAVARSLIQAHHGTTEVASRPGSTVFTVRLPRWGVSAK